MKLDCFNIQVTVADDSILCNQYYLAWRESIVWDGTGDILGDGEDSCK